MSIRYYITCFLLLLLATTSQAKIHPIAAGTDQITEVLSQVAPGDTLMLISSGGIYHETKNPDIRTANLTVMAAPDLERYPIWTTDDTRNLEVYHNMTIKGIHFDGQDETGFAIRTELQPQHKMVIDNCLFSNFREDAITDNNTPMGHLIIRNSQFLHIGQTALEFKTPDMCLNLSVENSTFAHIGVRAIHVVQRNTPLQVDISNVTIHDSFDGILIDRVDKVMISHSVITRCRDYGIKIHRGTIPPQLSYNCTFKNRNDYNKEISSGTGSIQADPLFFDSQNSNFALLSGSPCLKAGPDSSIIGDSRWAGTASQIASRQHYASQWQPIVGGTFLFIVLTFAVYQFAHWRVRERSQHRSWERRRTELEAHVAERTREIEAANEQLHREIVERRYVENALREARDELQSLVTERTRELESTQENLQELDEQLRQSQKLEAIGQLAGGIAHDFNNQLAIIRGYVDMVMDQMSPGTRIYNQLNQVSEAVLRSSKLTSQLLMFSSKQPVDTRALDLNEIISDLQGMFDRLLGEDIAVRLDQQENLWTVFADAGNIDQVLTNLAVNGRDAMPEGGVLTIRTNNIELSARESIQWPDVSPGRYVRLSVSDTGTGMSAETKEHLFEPFFTTKAPGKGTGLGLSVVYGIIQAHEGWIDVATELGKGTVFTIYLPAHEGEVQTETASSKAPSQDQQHGKGEHILLVEDEPALRDMKTQILTSRNYKVTGCESIVHALETVQNSDSPFDLLLSDVVLPDGRGTDLASKLTQDRPELPVVLVTGYTDERADWDNAQAKGWPILQKPVSIAKLLETVREALEKTA